MLINIKTLVRMANLHLIKTLAEKQNLPIKKLADMAGVSEQQIHLMCRTGSTKINTLEKIANILNVPISYFFEENVPTKIETTIERNELKGSHSFIAKNSSIDNRDYSVIKEKAEVKEITEEIVLPPNCPDDVKFVIESLKMENALLKRLLEKTENQLQEKERFLNHLLHN